MARTASFPSVLTYGPDLTILRVARRYGSVVRHQGQYLGVRSDGKVDRLTPPGQSASTGLTLQASSKLFSITDGLFAASSNRIAKLNDAGTAAIWSKTDATLGTIVTMADYLGHVVAGTLTDVFTLSRSQLQSATAPASVTKATVLPTGVYLPFTRVGEHLMALETVGPPTLAYLSPGVGLFRGQSAFEDAEADEFNTILSASFGDDGYTYVVDATASETRVRWFQTIYAYLPRVEHPAVNRGYQDVGLNSSGQVVSIVSRGGLGWLMLSAEFPAHVGQPELYRAVSAFANSITDAAVETEVPLPPELLPSIYPPQGIVTTAKGYDLDGGQYYTVATADGVYIKPGMVLRVTGDEGRALIVTGTQSTSGGLKVYVDPPIVYTVQPRLMLATTLRSRFRIGSPPPGITHDPFTRASPAWIMAFDEVVT